MLGAFLERNFRAGSVSLSLAIKFCNKSDKSGETDTYISKQNVVLSIATCSDLCGDSRGTSDIFSLLQCTDSIESHLACIHLSQETITEGQLILVRVGRCYLD